MVLKNAYKIVSGFVFALGIIIISCALVVIIRGHTPDGQIDFRLSALLLTQTYDPFAGTGDDTDKRWKEEITNLPLKGKIQPVAKVTDVLIPSTNGGVPVRIFNPKTGMRLPVIVFYHGGGWVFGSLTSHEVICRNMALEVPAVVVAVDYRLAPKYPFPAATDDSWLALSWVYEHAGEIGADSSRIAVMGDSAGGNLSAVMAQLARGKIPLSCQILVYPATDLYRPDTESYKKFDTGYFLSNSVLTTMKDMYAPRMEDRMLSRISPLRENDLRSLAPAYIITATFDALRDDGEDYAVKMRDAGVDVRLERAPGMIHGFLVMGGYVPEANVYISKCADYCAERFSVSK